MIKLFGPSQILKKDEEITVIRQGTEIPENVSYVDGKPVKRTFIKFTFVGNIQPLNGRDLLLVPENDRFKEQYWIYFNNDQLCDQGFLRTKDIPLVMVNDQIVRLGVNFQVQELEDWGSYARARIMRIDVGPQATP
jgi:hypothetical protein